MTVVNPKSISGINSITTGSGSDNLLTIHTSDASSTERVRINSSGDVIVGSGITVSPDGDVFTTGVTTSTTFVGALTGNVTGNVTGNISGGTVAGSTGTFSGAVSGTTGTFTGDLTIPDKIVHTGDTDTSIRLGVDTVTVETGGSERVRIDSSGNFGVGTNSPATLLHSNLAAENGSIAQFGLSGQTNNQSFIIKADDSDSLFTFRFGSTNSTYPAVRFNMGADVEAMRIDSSGRLMIGNTNASTMYQDGGDDLVIGNTSGSHGITIISQDNNVGRLMFSDTYTSGTGTYEGQILYSHALNTLNFYANYTNNSNLAMSLGGSNGDLTVHGGNVIIGTSGKGIDFSADGNASGNTSELLHDYEEGTWSATSLNYDYDGNQAQRGHYVKIGRIVHAFFRVKFHTQTNYTGQHLRFTGLPFTAADGNPYDVTVAGFAPDYGSVDFFRIYVQPGSTYAYWYTSTGSNYNNSTSLNNKDMRGCITYTASS